MPASLFSINWDKVSVIEPEPGRVLSTNEAYSLAGCRLLSKNHFLEQLQVRGGRYESSSSKRGLTELLSYRNETIIVTEQTTPCRNKSHIHRVVGITTTPCRNKSFSIKLCGMACGFLIAVATVVWALTHGLEAAFYPKGVVFYDRKGKEIKRPFWWLRDERAAFFAIIQNLREEIFQADVRVLSFIMVFHIVQVGASQRLESCFQYCVRGRPLETYVRMLAYVRPPRCAADVSLQFFSKICWEVGLVLSDRTYVRTPAPTREDSSALPGRT